ncbi:MAG: ABC transporter permease, partial [Bacteroidia bacterium]|nr:ABC transporter permease [Bacteroidia bacterium]
AYIAIGIFASSLTKNQIAAFILALLIGVCFHFLFGMIAATSSGWVGEIFQDLSLTNHYDSISRGVIDTKDIFYFLSIVFIGLVLSEFMVSKRA